LPDAFPQFAALEDVIRILGRGIRKHTVAVDEGREEQPAWLEHPFSLLHAADAFFERDQVIQRPHQ